MVSLPSMAENLSGSWGGGAAAAGGRASAAPQSGSSAGSLLPPGLSSAQVLCALALPELGRSSADWVDAAPRACTICGKLGGQDNKTHYLDSPANGFVVILADVSCCP